MVAAWRQPSSRYLQASADASVATDTTSQAWQPGSFTYCLTSFVCKTWCRILDCMSILMFLHFKCQNVKKAFNEFDGIDAAEDKEAELAHVDGAYDDKEFEPENVASDPLVTLPCPRKVP